MFSFLIKSSFYFLASFLLLSYEVNNKPIFFSIFQYTEPYTTSFSKIFKRTVKETVTTTKEVSTKMFTSSVPQNEIMEDSVKNKRAALKKKYLNNYTQRNSNSVDNYQFHEKVELDKIIENN